MLARGMEASGLSTVLVTMMTFFSEKIGVPRTVGVEFPFGHPFGMPHDRDTQTQVLRAALDLLKAAKEPGAICDLDLPWPQPQEVGYRDWQPPEPAPLVLAMREQRRREALEQR